MSFQITMAALSVDHTYFASGKMSESLVMFCHFTQQSIGTAEILDQLPSRFLVCTVGHLRVG